MSDPKHALSSMMVKIDGNKVRELREEKGLTQLYLATAVEVTTDTISRWENRRYPSIKRENCLRLAQALEVDITEIMENEVPNSSEPSHSTRSFSLSKVSKKLFVILFSFMVGIIFLGYKFYFKNNQPVIKATRYMPLNTIAGLPFPVKVQIVGVNDRDIPLILKESIPKKSSIISSLPLASTNLSDSHTIKWIQIVNKTADFVYVTSLDAPVDTTLSFSGSISIQQKSDTPIEVSGPNAITVGSHHWADSNTDNMISDHEILSVYDKFSGFSGIDIDIDLIERMWLGTNYSWDPVKKSFSIFP